MLTQHDAASLTTQVAREAAALYAHMATGGALHVVSTPIGNLADITLRALAVLSHASLVCCEDTRQTRTLLSRYGIEVRTLAVHEHNEANVIPVVLEELRANAVVVLVSDAGTPLVSDPGARLVRATIDAGFRVIPVPGASATLAALVASGLSSQPCTIMGFLPRKGRARSDALAMLAVLPHTSIVFESPNRLVDTLRDLSDGLGATRPATVARELTKLYEEVQRGTLAELSAYYEGTPPKGEVVIVLAGALPQPEISPSELSALAREWREAGFRPREVAQRLMDEHGTSRNEAYRLAHEI